MSAEYSIAWISLIAIATLRSPSHSLAYLVCSRVLTPAHVSWIYPFALPFGLCLNLVRIIALVPGLPLLSSPLDIVRRSPTTPVYLSTLLSCPLYTCLLFVRFFRVQMRFAKMMAYISMCSWHKYIKQLQKTQNIEHKSYGQILWPCFIFHVRSCVRQREMRIAAAVKFMTVMPLSLYLFRIKQLLSEAGTVLCIPIKVVGCQWWHLNMWKIIIKMQ